MALPASHHLTVHDLPVEILSRILLLGCSEGINPAQPFRPTPVERKMLFEVTVTHVCRRWRDVAIDTPGLWTSLRLRKAPHIEKCREFIQRSRCLVVDLLLEVADRKRHQPGITIGVDQLDEVFDFVDTYSERLRTFLCKVSDSDCKRKARSRLHTLPPVPHLETLQMYHVQRWADAEDLIDETTRAPVLIVRHQTQSLINLSIVGLSLAWSLNHTPFLAGLKVLDLALHAVLTRPTLHEWVTILRSCPDLQRLTLHYSGPRLDGPWPIEPITLPRLCEIGFADIEPETLCAIISTSLTPTVQSLTLELADQDVTAFIKFATQARSFPELRRLHIKALNCDASAWTVFLKTVPKVSELRLDVDDDFLDQGLFDILYTSSGSSDDIHLSLGSQSRQVASPTHPGILLPALSTFKVTGIPSVALQHLVSFRKRLGHPIASVIVCRRSHDQAIDGAQILDEIKYCDLSDGEQNSEGSEDERQCDEGQDDEVVDVDSKRMYINM